MLSSPYELKSGSIIGGKVMNKADKLERIARAQAKALRATLKLFSELDYLDSYGQDLEGKLNEWLNHTKQIRRAK